MIIDAHVHTFTGDSAPGGGGSYGEIVECAAAAGIDKIALSSLGRKSYIPLPTQKQVNEANSDVLRIMQDYPDRVYGFCYINPLNPDWEDELKLCAENGFTGLKLWIAAKCSDPIICPVIERAIDKKMPVLVHAFIKTNGNLQNESTPYDVASLALEYPEARILMAHAGGCRKEGLEALRPAANVSVDTSGTHPEIGAVETAAEILGAGRVIFGSDAPGRSFAVQLQKVKAAVLDKSQKELILSKNFMRLIKP